MSKKLHLIYIPGLGDAKIKRQKQAVSTWRFWGVSSEVIQMNWHEGDWETKFHKVLDAVDAAVTRGEKVGLVGASAGAGAVINVMAARKKDIVGAVLIAGKVNRPHGIGGSYRSRHSPFVDSAYAAVDSLASLTPTDRKRILSRFALIDPIVPAPDSRIPHAINRVVPTAGHVFTIASQLLVGAPSFIRFLKHCAKR